VTDPDSPERPDGPDGEPADGELEDGDVDDDYEARAGLPATGVSLERSTELVSFIAQSLVDDPDAVSVRAVPGDRATILELTVAQEDLGKVIGKDGRTARAIRTLLSATCTKLGGRVMLEILE